MSAIVRAVLGIVAGITLSLVLLVGVELFSAVVHPFPEGFEGTHEEICDHVADYPDWILAVVVPMWGAIALLGTWVAGRLGNGFAALVLAVLLLAAVIFNIAMLPYPKWFTILQPLVILVAVHSGYRWSARPSSPPVASA